MAGLYKSLEDYIRQRSRDLDMSLHALSERLNYSPSYLNNVVSGQFTPSEKRCREIAAAFGDDPATILKLADYWRPPSGEEHADVMALVRGLPKRELGKLRSFLAYLTWKKDNR